MDPRGVNAGKDRRELAEDVGIKLGEAPPVQPSDVLVERIDQNPEGQIGFELRRPASQHQGSASISAACQLSKKARFANTRLAPHLERGRPRLSLRRSASVRLIARTSWVRPTRVFGKPTPLPPATSSRVATPPCLLAVW